MTRNKQPRAAELPRIVHAGHPVLRQMAAPVPRDEIGSPAMQVLVSTMVRVMRRAPGVGLAAPQIGVGLQVIVLEDRDEFLRDIPADALAARERIAVPLTVIFNPVLTAVETSESPTFREGCLSVPGYSAVVPRHREVIVEGFDGSGAPWRWQTQGWPARILQHEVDHLRGALYIDRMDSRSFAAD